MESSHYCFSLSTQVPYLDKGSPTENYVSLWISGKSTVWLRTDDYTNNNHPVNTLSDAVKHLARNSLFCKLDCSQAHHFMQIADRRSVEMIIFHFASWTLPTKDLYKVWGYLCPFFWVSCVRSWTQWSKLTNLLKIKTALESQPVKLRTLPGTFG